MDSLPATGLVRLTSSDELSWRNWVMASSGSDASMVVCLAAPSNDALAVSGQATLR